MNPDRTRELRREGSTHPSIEELARLLEDPNAPPSELSRIGDHVAQCRRCFGVLAELTETTFTWRSGSTADAQVPAELLEAARSMRVPSARRAQPRTTRPARRRAILAVAGVALATVAVGLFALNGPGGRSVRASATVLAPVEQAIAQASRTGMILTADLAPGNTPRRTLGVPGSPGLSHSIDELVKLHDQPGAGDDIAFWLVAGMLTDGDAGARTILEESRVRFPRSRRLEHLEAVVAYRESRLVDSERTLVRLVREDPRDPVALFNLSLLLRETGREREAQRIEVRLLEVLPRNSLLRTRVGFQP